MSLKALDISGFKSFGGSTRLEFNYPVSAIVGPNGSGKSNIADAIRFALGEQSFKSLRGGKGEDLIFNGSHKSPRKNRASVSLLFNNELRIFPLEIPEILVERTVHRDGINEYLLNNSKVRLKDKLELLSQANIGPTGHHIVSQGEADRFLSATPEELRLLIEDALGLNIYKLRLKEARQKIARASERLRDIESTIVTQEPRVRELELECRRLRAAEQKHKEIVTLYSLLFTLQERLYSKQSLDIQELKDSLEKELQETKENLSSIGSPEAMTDEEVRLAQEKASLQKELRHTEHKLQQLIEERGELNGQLKAGRVLQDEYQSKSGIVTVSHKQMERLSARADHINHDHDAGRISGNQAFQDLFSEVKEFTQDIKVDTPQPSTNTQEINQLEHQLREVDLRIKSHKDTLESQQIEIKTIESKERELSRSRIEHVQKRSSLLHRIKELEDKIHDVNDAFDRINRKKASYKEEQASAAIRYGRMVLEESEDAPEEIYESHIQQTRQQIIRYQAQIEDIDVALLDELEKALDEEGGHLTYLVNQQQDIVKAIQQTAQLSENLHREIGHQLNRGVQEINERLNHFFATLFGGGQASLDFDASDTDDETPGLLMNVQLPFKQVRSIHALSGGERSLASLALLFAVSLLNPPPFIVLDETDAALDEANSRRYAELIKDLSSHTQLILITHNRETMTYADELFGVTMGSDGVSRLLSVTLADALPMGK